MSTCAYVQPDTLAVEACKPLPTRPSLRLLEPRRPRIDAARSTAREPSLPAPLPLLDRLAAWADAQPPHHRVGHWLLNLH